MFGESISKALPTMAIIERHLGCPGPGKAGGCYGPVGPYYTLFDTELHFLTTHIIVSLLIGLIIFSGLFILTKKGKIKFSLYVNILLSLISTIISFFILAYFFPLYVVY